MFRNLEIAAIVCTDSVECLYVHWLELIREYFDYQNFTRTDADHLHFGYSIPKLIKHAFNESNNFLT